MPEIRFDIDSITDEVSLLKQVCVRLDRHFPNWEENIQAAELLTAAKAMITGWSTELADIGFNTQAQQLNEMVME